MVSASAGGVDERSAKAANSAVASASKAKLVRSIQLSIPAKWTPVRRQEHAPIKESRACSDSKGTEHALASHERRRPMVRVEFPTLRDATSIHRYAGRAHDLVPLGLFLGEECGEFRRRAGTHLGAEPLERGAHLGL